MDKRPLHPSIWERLLRPKGPGGGGGGGGIFPEWFTYPFGWEEGR